MAASSARPKVPAHRRAFGDRLRALRTEQELTQERLADRAGLHPVYIGEVERGLRNISLDNIRKLAKGLGVDTGDLFADQRFKFRKE